MGEGLKNIICSPSDALSKLKIKLMGLISLKKIQCDLPFNIPSSIPSLPSINPSQAVIDFLKDILAVIRGLNYDEMKAQLIAWLVNAVRPLEKDLNINLKRWLKKCYACKTTTTIPHWLFKTDPSTYTLDGNNQPIPGTGSLGKGINIPLNKIDHTCIFNVNPSSSVGKLVYDGDIDNDMNTFLWQVIQDNDQAPNAPRLWKDPVTGQPIAWFSYKEDDSTAFITQTNTGGPQDADPIPMVFTMYIDDSYYHQNKNTINFINDYLNAQTPLFDADVLIPNTIELIFGTITNEIQLPEECVTNIVELETAIEDYINIGIDNPDIETDDSFYTFAPEQMVQIKNKVKNKQLGSLQFQKCCQKKRSKVAFNNLSKFNADIKQATQLNERINVYSGAINNITEEMSLYVPAHERDFAINEFFSEFITGLQVALTKLVLMPKLLMLFQTMNFLVTGKIVNDASIKDILKQFECLIREILRDLIRKLIYEFLLPLIIKALRQLIQCAITAKLKEKNAFNKLSRTSLLPGFVSDKLEDVNKAMGNVSKDGVDKAKGFANKVQNKLNNIDLQGKGNRGKLC